MNKENKPCPFCGKNDSQDIFCKTVPYYVTCYACDAFGPDAETPEEAWEKWNKRSGENAITERC